MSSTILDRKPILSTRDLLEVLPGGGTGFLGLLLDSRWLAPCNPNESRPLYDSLKVRACLERVGNGEMPRPVYVWRTALGQDSAHLVDRRGKPVCNTREREWMGQVSNRQCTRCMGAAKALRVEEA